jgi:hypothetical protein
MRVQTTKPLTKQQEKLIAAINRGVGSIRDLQAAAGYSSTSVTKYNLGLLEARGEVVLLKAPGGTQKVYTGREFARAWDAAAQLAGNPDA